MQAAFFTKRMKSCRKCLELPLFGNQRTCVCLFIDDLRCWCELKVIDVDLVILQLCFMIVVWHLRLFDVHNQA